MPNSFDLGNQLESFIAELVKSGRYNSKSEASREGVRLLQERDARFAAPGCRHCPRHRRC
jgi:antitoxin ParD1/3/4